MYGLVNRAILELVEQRCGSAAKREVREASNSPEFVSMDAYPDTVTLQLVAAAAEHLEVEVESFLEELGWFWVNYTGSEGYGDMFDMWGADIRSFLSNLNLMHERVKMTMPHLAPPVFETQEEEDGAILLFYRSHRAGLTPMVAGLLKGLGERFATPIEIARVPGKEDPNSAVFRIRLLDA